MINRSREANQQYGFFVPALVTVFLVVIFIALLFGSKLLKKSEPIEVQFSARYHELKAKEHLTEEESAEFELERCRFDRDLVNYIEKNDPSRFDHAKANYETRCQDKLPLQRGGAAEQPKGYAYCLPLCAASGGGKAPRRQGQNENSATIFKRMQPDRLKRDAPSAAADEQRQAIQV